MLLICTLSIAVVGRMINLYARHSVMVLSDLPCVWVGSTIVMTEVKVSIFTWGVFHNVRY